MNEQANENLEKQLEEKEAHVASVDENLVAEKHLEEEHIGEYVEKTGEHERDILEEGEEEGEDGSLFKGLSMVLITIGVILVVGIVIYFSI